MAALASRSLRTVSALAVVGLLVASATPAGHAARRAAPGTGGAEFRISVADAATPSTGDPASMTIGLTPGGSATLTRTVTTATVPPRPDVVLLADTTASMGGALEDVKANARRIVADISAVQPDARFAVAEYRDNGDEYAFRLNQDLTADPAGVQEAVNTWFPAGGGDVPEANLYALARVATGAVALRTDSSPIVAIFGDAPSHDPALGHDLAGTVAALTARGIRVVAVDVATSPYSSLDQTGQFTEITTRTGGVLLTAASADEVSTAILTGIRAIQATVGARVSDCDPQLSADVTPGERTVDSGGSVDVALSVRVDPKARNGEYACRLEFTVDGILQEGPDRLVVQVTGAAPDVPVLHSDTTLLDLGEAAIGVATPTRRVTLSNTGDYPLSVAATLAAPAPSGTASMPVAPSPALVPVVSAPVSDVFTVTGSTCGPVLAVGASCTLDVGGTPRAVGVAHAVLTLASSTDTGGQAAQALAVQVTGRSPSLQFNPGVGRPGQVVTGLGRDFPPGQPVTVTWAGGTGAVTVVADAAGRFAVPMVVFVDAPAGPRTAVASVPAVGTVTSGAFLVQSPTAQPGVFTRRR
ncbi:von Willebrand factor type A domain-containing protein [Micromonospora pallida]|uniref:von Willebrand factor type A domain-containing protein n=1 Tax=Micromonospora pallida TaxID=145854 RepID=A0A1C6T0N9_9ACTN|nr:VWA domain-containing protein [Micromonospora pallida]SCL35202.1 von Willebrand factor type A domain-containing protein [Micromonospora pallida]